MEYFLRHFFVILVVGFLAQFIDSTIGMGFGAISASLLLYLGATPLISSASIHAAEFITSIVSGVAHQRLGNTLQTIFSPLAITGIIGGFLGAYTLTRFNFSLAILIVESLLLILGLIMLYMFLILFKNIKPRKKKTYTVWKVNILGFFAGFFDAIAGGGWGAITSLAFLLKGTEPRVAVGSISFAEMFVAGGALLGFIIFGGQTAFEVAIVVPLLIGGVVAAPIGAWLCKKMPQRWLGVAIGLGIVLLSAKKISLVLGIA